MREEHAVRGRGPDEGGRCWVAIIGNMYNGRGDDAETQEGNLQRWAHTIRMVFDLDKGTQTQLVGVTLAWLTRGNPQLMIAWRQRIMDRATKLHQSGGYSVLSQNISSEEM